MYQCANYSKQSIRFTRLPPIPNPCPSHSNQKRSHATTAIFGAMLKTYPLALTLCPQLCPTYRQPNANAALKVGVGRYSSFWFNVVFLRSRISYQPYPGERQASASACAHEFSESTCPTSLAQGCWAAVARACDLPRGSPRLNPSVDTSDCPRPTAQRGSPPSLPAS